MTYRKTDWKAWIAMIFAVLCTFWIHRYEQTTLKMEERLEAVEEFSEGMFESIQKINCQSMYDARFCEEDYLIVPPYETVEEAIIEIIKQQEGFRPKAYRDGCDKRTNGVCVKARYSIGYGTREKVRGEVITEAEATRRLKEHLEKNVFPFIPENVTDKGTYIALADLGYNSGARAISACVNFDGTLNIEEYQKWTMTNGKSNDALVRRRRSVLIYMLSIKE